MHGYSNKRPLLLALIATFSINLAALGVASAAIDNTPDVVTNSSANSTPDTDSLQTNNTATDLETPDTNSVQTNNNGTDLDRPDVNHAGIDRPEVADLDSQTPDISRPDVPEPDIQQPDIQRPDVQTAEIDH